ncbi:MAG: hypothetical protein KC646_05735 [Candidatus Cloacimonetes bacterium]|nr:hypothetical protein [Candidatus Cloacimonadota bacterium]
MKRVKKYVKEFGGHAYQPWKNDPWDKALGMKRNERWIRDHIKKERKIIDIGPDFKRRREEGNISGFMKWNVGMLINIIIKIMKKV